MAASVRLHTAQNPVRRRPLKIPTQLDLRKPHHVVVVMSPSAFYVKRCLSRYLRLMTVAEAFPWRPGREIFVPTSPLRWWKLEIM